MVVIVNEAKHSLSTMRVKEYTFLQSTLYYRKQNTKQVLKYEADINYCHKMLSNSCITLLVWIIKMTLNIVFINKLTVVVYQRQQVICIILYFRY